MRLRDNVTDILNRYRIPSVASGHWTAFANVDTKLTGPHRKVPSYIFRHLARGYGIPTPERQPTLADVLRIIVLRYR